MSELQERTFHSENDKRRFTLSFSPDRLFFTISWRNKRGVNASHFNILRDEAISVAEDILDRYNPAESAPAPSFDKQMLAGPRDWPEDFPSENCNYQNICCECGQVFIGHKRRVVCKVCVAEKDESAKTDANTG